MKFNFKIQQYQTDDVEAVARVFAGQGHHNEIKYRRDLGKVSSDPQQVMFDEVDEYGETIIWHSTLLQPTSSKYSTPTSPTQ